MQRGRIILVSLAVAALLAAAVAVALRVPSAPPVIRYLGVSADGMALRFELHNPTGATWSYFGPAPGAPVYRLFTPGSTPGPAEFYEEGQLRPPMKPWIIHALRGQTRQEFLVPLSPEAVEWMEVEVPVLTGSRSGFNGLFKEAQRKLRMGAPDSVWPQRSGRIPVAVRRP